METLLVIIAALIVGVFSTSTDASPCPDGATGLFPDVDSCARYFLCVEGEVVPYSSLYPAYECPYPTLFSETDRHCQPYNLVDCGMRSEPKQPCDYYGEIGILDPWPGAKGRSLPGLRHRRRQEGQGRIDLPPGVSCEMVYPPCLGLPDGLNPWLWREGSPYHVDCLDERTLRNLHCSNDEFGYVMRFSPTERRCVSQWEFPKNDSGRRPDCQSKPDGFFLDESGWCSYYFECRNGDFHKFYQCSEGKFFSSASGRCEDGKLAPHPCGAAGSPDCSTRANGFYPDAGGRHQYYFVCAASRVRGVFQCPQGEAFDAEQGVCRPKGPVKKLPHILHHN